LATIKQTLTETLLAGGKELKKGILQKKRISFKTPISLVTQVDMASEKAILKILKRRFPSHAILAEESGLKKTGSPHKWIIDPLDGTTNFSHNLAQACVSVAYEFEGEVKMGGIYDPFRNELFFAEKNKGAFLNKKRIHVSKTKTLKRSLVVTGFPYDRAERPEYYLKFLKPFIQKTQGIRRLGSAALDLCYIACGRFDAYWEIKLNPWDVAAGSLIVREAGGRMSDLSGRKHSIYGEETLAANPYVYPIILKELKKAKKQKS
jgi:myo-inositol-1(or 4)-monophosphatase